MNQNKWFKHWNNAHQGQTISQLWAERDGPEVIAFYWTVLELVSQFEDPNNRGTWEGNLSIFKSKLGMNRNRSYKLLCKICVTFETKITWKSQESFQLFIPNWPKLQETRGGKREAKTEQKPDRSKRREERGKNTTKKDTAPSKLVAEEYPDEFIPVVNDLVLKGVPSALVVKWKELYGAEWVLHEIKEALAWEIANPTKKKKYFDRFMNGWLNRGWKNKKTQTVVPEVVSKAKVSLK